ncbi:hypothetical protein Pcinc_007334 [Petrolisthes cinctipes]|uniref:Uncharacterized protein n=1 Tax=Petrolisthes cinctipes TaxID=88211 RepID=A0AAE1KY91_PETCI|nr:hypothetical protein Pcinc_007334 [Petrolisthes cinctipes]
MRCQHHRPTTRQSAARPRRVHTLFSVGLAMADQDAHEEQPRRSYSIEKKRPSGDDEKGDKKRRKGVPSIQACSLRDSPVPADGDVGCSGLGNKSSECGTASNDKLDKLTFLLSGLIEKLDNNAQGPSTSDAPYYGGFHDLSSSDEDCVVAEGVTYDTDPLDNLDTICPAQPSLQTDVDDASFLRALDELSDCFHGDEPKGDPLSDRLASILNVSLRRRPNSDTVKTTCSRLKVPNNVPNMKVPETNSAITKVMNVGGKLLDARLAHTNNILLRALVPLAICISNIGEKTGKPLNTYLEGFNDSLRLVVSAFNYINQLRKEVIRFHVIDNALSELCKGGCEVGTDELFPFDVVKKCDEIHKTKKLGRPSFRPYKFDRMKTAHQFRQGTRKPLPYRSRSFSSSRPFLGQRQPWGRRTQNRYPQ